jgi:hypothetical protein
MRYCRVLSFAGNIAVRECDDRGQLCNDRDSHGAQSGLAESIEYSNVPLRISQQTTGSWDESCRAEQQLAGLW